MKQSSDMLEFTADGAMPENEDGTVILRDKAAGRLLGYLAQDVIGRHFLLSECEHRPGAREEA